MAGTVLTGKEPDMLTLSSLLERSEATFGHHVAMLDSGLSWREHVMRVRQIVSAFDMSHGMRFAIMAPNCETQAELFHAGYMSGAVPVPINWRLAPPEMKAVLEDCAPERVFLSEDFAALQDDELLSEFLKDAVLVGPNGVDASHLSGVLPMRWAPVSAEDLAIILYTGGTTGKPKGVCLSHRNVTANALQVAPILQFGESSRYLHLAPMFHGADLIATGVTMLGGAHGFAARFDPAGFVSQARIQRITATMLAPAVVRMLVDIPDMTLPDLRMLIYGSSPMDATLIRETCAKFPDAGIRQGYGLTETGPLLSILGAREHSDIARGIHPELAFSAGRPLPGVEMQVVDNKGQRCAPGIAGEVVARGPNVTSGYYENVTETDAAFDGEWFRTGDIGRIEDSGYLFLMDRAKDMIITGGQNVYSIEVEDVLLAHPEIAEAAVIGLPHPKWGEELTAVLVAAGQGPDAETVRTHCRERLAGYKVPRRVVFVDALPRSAVGKVLKHALRAGLEDTDG